MRRCKKKKKTLENSTWEEMGVRYVGEKTYF